MAEAEESSSTHTKPKRLDEDMYFFSKSLEYIISRPNCISDNKYINYVSAYDAFSRFLLSIEEATGFVKTDLSTLIFPMFVHLYLKVLENNGIDNAQYFFDQFGRLFENEKSYESILKELYALETPTAVMKHKYFKHFWVAKYIIEISADAKEYLQTLLEDIDCKPIFDILKIHFLFKNPNFCDAEAKKKNTCFEKDESFKDIDVKEIMISAATINGPYNEKICSVDINEDATQIFAAFGSSVIHIFEKNYETNDEYVLKKNKKFDDEINDGPIYTVKALPNPDKSLLLKAYNHKILLLDTNDMTYLESYSHDHFGRIMSMDVETTSSYFVTGSVDGSVSLFDVNKNFPLRKYESHVECINVVKFHPSGRYIATGSDDHSLGLWSVDNAKMIRTFFHDFTVFACEFSPDGEYIAIGDDVGCVKIWDIVEGCKPIWQLNDYKGGDVCSSRITDVCFHPNSSTLAICGWDDTIKIWKYKSKSSNLYCKKFEETPLFMKFFENEKLKAIFQKRCNL